MKVRVSVASMRQAFHGCEPDYIATVCFGRCCDAPSRPGGSMVTIHTSERRAIEARGGEVRDNLLVTEDGCTFKTEDSLCGLHLTEDKPFGCIASPFTLNDSDCLVVRNRYRMLVCYGRKGTEESLTYPPAYEAFRASLELIFGPETTADLVHYLKMTDAKFLEVDMPDRSYAILHDNDRAKRSA